MRTIKQSFSVKHSYAVHFTKDVFSTKNDLFKTTIENDGGSGTRKMLVFIDDGVTRYHPLLSSQINDYAEFHNDIIELVCEPLVVPGGEPCKNDPLLLDIILSKINTHGIDRHSYIIGIGGGAVLDLVGYASSIAHRGIRHIRIPTTVLSQNDSGVGVKTGINAFGKKNFLGTFVPPYAVINDHTFLTTLDVRDWRSGISEAIKVALIKDVVFFNFIKANAQQLVARDINVMNELIYRCAKLHLEHISSEDPFEMGSSRPLDFGHWASHKLEGLTNYQIRHGEAVAIGICLDSIYSHLTGRLPRNDLDEIINLIIRLGFQIYRPELAQGFNSQDKPDNLLSGLTEFREHLGGKLTIMLLQSIGKGIEVNEMDKELIKESIGLLKSFQAERYIIQTK